MKYLIIALLISGCASTNEVRIREIEKTMKEQDEEITRLETRAQEAKRQCEELSHASTLPLHH